MNEERRKKLEEFSNLFDEYIDDQVYKDRPKRYDDFYIRMENIADYEYTYVLAYELSQKNKKVKGLIEQVKYYQENLEEYSKILNITDFYKDSIDLGYGGFLEEKKSLSYGYEFFTVSELYLTLNDIESFPFDLNVEHIGLWKLISYLINTNNLYSYNNNGQCKQIDIEEVEKKIDDIMEYPYKYATYCKNKDSNELKLIVLSKDMPLNILDQEFLKEINMIRIKNKVPNAKINYSVPTLKFKNEKVVNFPINLNLCKEELIAYISKIKDDFDNNKNIVKSPLEIFGESLNDAKEPKSRNKTISKKGFADAIYIYDLYKYIENIYEKKLKKDINYKKSSLHVDVSLASGISDSHNYFLKTGRVKNNKHKKSDTIEILKKSDTIEKLYKLMKEYIDNEKYKELVTGSEKKEILGMWDSIPLNPMFSIAEDELNKKY